MATLRIICLAVLSTSILAVSAYAQNDAKPLNLNLPPSKGFPVASAASTAPASATPASGAPTIGTPTSGTPTGTAPTSVNTAPGVYYGDTSGTPVAGVTANNPDATDSCDDATYNKPQVHGTVGVGVVAGNHFSGNYQTGTVDISKPTGDCKHPTGGLNISIGVSQGHFGYQRGSH